LLAAVNQILAKAHQDAQRKISQLLHLSQLLMARFRIKVVLRDKVISIPVPLKDWGKLPS